MNKAQQSWALPLFPIHKICCWGLLLALSFFPVFLFFPFLHYLLLSLHTAPNITPQNVHVIQRDSCLILEWETLASEMVMESALGYRLEWSQDNITQVTNRSRHQGPCGSAIQLLTAASQMPLEAGKQDVMVVILRCWLSLHPVPRKMLPFEHKKVPFSFLG